MKHLKRYQQYSKVEEGWKHNLLAGLSLLANTAFGKVFSEPTSSNVIGIEQVEKEVKQTKKGDDQIKFFAACLEIAQGLTDGAINANLSMEQMDGLLQAKLYFQAMRDGQSAPKLEKQDIASIKAIYSIIKGLSIERINQLAESGMTAKVYGETTGR